MAKVQITIEDDPTDENPKGLKLNVIADPPIESRDDMTDAQKAAVLMLAALRDEIEEAMEKEIKE